LLSSPKRGFIRTDDKRQKAQAFHCPLSVFMMFDSAFGVEKTSFASNASGDLSGQAPNPRLVARIGEQSLETGKRVIHPSSVLRRPYSGSTECASSSQCQISLETEDGRRRTDKSLDDLLGLLYAQRLRALDETDKIASEGWEAVGSGQ
jgi:hypothetical protein